MTKHDIPRGSFDTPLARLLRMRMPPAPLSGRGVLSGPSSPPLILTSASGCPPFLIPSSARAGGCPPFLILSSARAGGCPPFLILSSARAGGCPPFLILSSARAGGRVSKDAPSPGRRRERRLQCLANACLPARRKRPERRAAMTKHDIPRGSFDTPLARLLRMRMPPARLFGMRTLPARLFGMMPPAPSSSEFARAFAARAVLDHIARAA